jgi:hypothetical protein
MFFNNFVPSPFFAFCAVVFISNSTVFGGKIWDSETFKQPIFLNAKAIKPLNDAPCTADVLGDIIQKCTVPSSSSSCSDDQDYVNCASDVVHKDCGNDGLKKFCNVFNQQTNNYGNPCNLKCSEGGKSFDSEAFKKLIFSSTKAITPLNEASCGDVDDDFQNKCREPNPYYATCNDAQDYLNCAISVVRKDCGNDGVKEYCDRLTQQLDNDGDSCDLKCSANTLFVSSCIGAISLYKMFLEKFMQSL